MRISFSRTRSDLSVSYAKSGEALIVDGEVFDFAGLAEGDTLPQRAIQCDHIVGKVARNEGVIQLTVAAYCSVKGLATDLPPVLLTQDGPVTGFASNQSATETPGAIDWSLRVTLADVLRDTKEQALREMISALSQAADAITGPVPQAERDSWPAKADAARAFQTETATASQLAMLDKERMLTGETLEELAAKIIPNADAYEQAIGTLSGLRRTTTTAIDAATTPDEAQAALGSLTAALAGTGGAL